MERPGVDSNIAFDALRRICEDFQSHIGSGGLPETVQEGSPRFFSLGSEPGDAIQYLAARLCVRIEKWEPDYALGGQSPSFLVIPTEYGMAVLDRSREQGELTFLPSEF